MTILFAGNIAAINRAQENQMPGNVFVHPDGTVNGVLFLLAGIFLFLTLPTAALLSGAFLGAVRAFLVTLIVVGSTTGLWLAHTFLQHIPININFNSPGPISFILLPLTAALVGFLYDRRRSAAWWKSFLILLLGSAFLVTVMLAFVAIFGRPTSTASLTDFYIGIGCIWVLLIPLMALPIAGIEGITHAIIAARRNKQNSS
jgi:hypothetical protein